MTRDIHDAYQIYKRITCDFEDLDLIPEIFTDDFVGGNAVIGQIRGLEAQTIFLSTCPKMGIEPEDHLWCMVDGNNLAFRARNWRGKKHESPFFDMIGHLLFDATLAKFCFYYGFLDPSLAMKTMGNLEVAGPMMQAALEASRRYQSQPGFDPKLPDHLTVSSEA